MRLNIYLYFIFLSFLIPKVISNSCPEHCNYCDDVYGCYECESGYYPIEGDFPVICSACHESCKMPQSAEKSNKKDIKQEKMQSIIAKLIEENKILKEEINDLKSKTKINPDLTKNSVFIESSFFFSN